MGLLVLPPINSDSKKSFCFQDNFKFKRQASFYPLFQKKILLKKQLPIEQMGLTLLSLFLTAGSPGLPVYDLSNWAQILLLGGKERQNFRFRKKFQFYTGMTVSAKLQGRDLSDRGTHFLLLQFSISKEEQTEALIQQMALALLSLLTAGRPGLAGSQNAYDLAGWLSWNPRRGKNWQFLQTFNFFISIIVTMRRLALVL